MFGFDQELIAAIFGGNFHRIHIPHFPAKMLTCCFTRVSVSSASCSVSGALVDQWADLDAQSQCCESE